MGATVPPGSRCEAAKLLREALFLKPCAVVPAWRRFRPEAITKHHRLIQVGTRHPQNARVVEPYVVDRRHVPGTAAPESGEWQKGDGVINIDPDPAVPDRACRGWICVEAGQPGRWLPYGVIADQ